VNAYAITALPEIAPVWHCLLVAPQKEMATREHLRANGVYAFYPSREKRYTRQGKTIRIERPEVTGYVFAQFRQRPMWHVMKEKRRLITGVLGVNGVPVEINRDVIRHLQGLTLEAAKLEEARREMFRVRPGDKATFAEGPLKGFVVDITEIKGGEAAVAGLFGFKSKAALSALERIIPSSEKDALPFRASAL
jgi:transcription antitermination factor NusG